MQTINIIETSVEGAARVLAGVGQVFVIYDRKAEAVVEKLKKHGLQVKASFDLEACEENKTLDTIERICCWLLDEGAGRDAFVLGVGGGITTDLTGFAASVYKRGVRFGFIPTTLLSQVDAAIGGKNGVNLRSYKNILGTIRQSEMTFVCPEVLESLPPEEIVGGAAELLKTFLIDNSQDLYEETVATLAGIRETFLRTGKVELPEDLRKEVAAAARIKAGIAGRDPFEGGERRLLNLGHTFAHAIEKKSQESGPISHGAAVSIGIILAARLAERLGLASPGLAAKLEKDFGRAGMRTECPFEILDLVEAMAKDKKAEGGTIHFVLPLSVGEVIVHDLSAEQAAERVGQKARPHVASARHPSQLPADSRNAHIELEAD